MESIVFSGILARNPDIHAMNLGHDRLERKRQVTRAPEEVVENPTRSQRGTDPLLQFPVLPVVNLSESQGRMLRVPGFADLALRIDVDLDFVSLGKATSFSANG